MEAIFKACFEDLSGSSDAHTEAGVIELTQELNYEISNIAAFLGDVAADYAEAAHIKIKPFALQTTFPEDCVANATDLLTSATMRAKQLIYTLMVQSLLAKACGSYLRNSKTDDSIFSRESFGVYVNWRASTYRQERWAAGGRESEVALRAHDLRVALRAMLRLHGFADTSFVDERAGSSLDDIARICVSLKSSIAQGVMSARLEPVVAEKGQTIDGLVRVVMQGFMNPQRVLCATGLGIRSGTAIAPLCTRHETLLLPEVADVTVLDWGICT